LAGLLDLVVGVLKNLPRVRLATLPRMADFARVLAAMDNADISDKKILHIYLGQRSRIAEDVVQSDPVACAIVAMLSNQTTWKGTISDLLKAITPKTVQVVMRHSSITLTMDAYGHLFPGQEADAVGRTREMLAGPPETLRATGTDDAAANVPTGAQQQAQQSGRETMRASATGCQSQSDERPPKTSRKPLQLADLGDDVRDDASWCASRPGGIRTPDQGIMSPLL
jgi:hypothetical protein